MSFRASRKGGLGFGKKVVQLTGPQLDYCMECGVCTGSCPISRERSSYSPRQIIKRTMMDPGGDLLQSREIWACLSCGRCKVRCPVEIDFPEFNRSYRQAARRAGNLPLAAHHGLLETIVRLQTRDLTQRRTGWAEEAGLFRERGDYFYFVGCLPYFEVIFRYLDLSSLDIARSVLGLLNRIGLEPVISNEERCCGHDALWRGDEDTFRELARRNLEMIKASGAKTVLFSCPEGYFTFRHHYPQYFGELGFEVVHLTEFLARELPGAGLSFPSSPQTDLTFQDPCRLGRWAELYEPPRQVLQLLPETRLVEMERHKENALCCGTAAWMECSDCSKAIQVERLQEALQTGARTLVTACPKCQIHLTCALSGTGLELRVTDLFTYLAERLCGDETQGP